jgi:aminopeptidase N
MKVGETTISSYYLPGYRRPAEAAMKTTAEAVELFSERFGDYPRSTLIIVQADLSDSRAFSGLSFISRNFYQLYDGTSKNYLTFAAIDAAAHQWWFDQVGNDPAAEPWLDEALATYSEMLYFERTTHDQLAYWQANRVDFFRPQGRINVSIYDAVNYDAYKQSVYFNGVYFLQDLRERIGDYALNNFLRDYYRQGTGNISTEQDFFRILGEHTETDISDLLWKYFEDQE